MNQSMLLRIREPNKQRMVPHFLPMIAQLENKCRQYMPVPAEIGQCRVKFFGVMVTSIGEESLVEYFNEGLREIDYAMSNYV